MTAHSRTAGASRGPYAVTSGRGRPLSELTSIAGGEKDDRRENRDHPYDDLGFLCHSPIPGSEADSCPALIARLHGPASEEDHALSHSLAARAFLERSEIVQTLIDVIAVLFIFLLSCGFAFAVAAATFLMFFASFQ